MPTAFLTRLVVLTTLSNRAVAPSHRTSPRRAAASSSGGEHRPLVFEGERFLMGSRKYEDRPNHYIDYSEPREEKEQMGHRCPAPPPRRPR